MAVFLRLTLRVNSSYVNSSLSLSDHSDIFIDCLCHFLNSQYHAFATPVSRFAKFIISEEIIIQPNLSFAKTSAAIFPAME
jgi:hypothetical protein